MLLIVLPCAHIAENREGT